MPTNPERAQRLIASDQAAASDAAHRVFDQLDAAMESIVVSTNVLSNLGIENRRQRQALRDVQAQMDADDREWDRQRMVDLTHYALRFLADDEVPPLVTSPEHADIPTPIYDLTVKAGKIA